MNRQFKTSLVLLVIGLAAIGAGFFTMITGRDRASRDTEPAAATVIDYYEDYEYDSGTETYDDIYYPVMSYEAGGETIESQYYDYEYSPTYQIGETVDIKYNPDDPQDFIMACEGDRSVNFNAVWQFGGGAVLILAALGRIFVPMIIVRGKNG